MADLRKHSSTSNIVRFKLTKSADGTAFTGATSASTGLSISTICDNEATATAYTVAGSTIETITTLGTFAAPTATKCRFKEVDATNHAGLYEFQFADARYAISSAKRLVISVSGISGLFSADYEIQLTQADVYDATRMGLTALPNAAADAAGGLVISDAGGFDIDTKLSVATSALATPTNITAGVITTVTNLTNAPTNGDLTATMKTSVTTAATAATPIAASVTGNVGGNVVGSVGSVTGAVGSVTGAVGSVTGTVGGIAGTIQTLDALDTAQDTQHTTTQNYLSTNVGLLGANLTAADDAVIAAIATAQNDLNTLTGSDGVTLATSQPNAVVFSAGMEISSTTGDALALTSTGGNGVGLVATGNGAGAGIRGQGGTTGPGILGMGGATSGAGIRGSGNAGNGQGIVGLGNGSGAGIQGSGGATGPGLYGAGGANGSGIVGLGQGSGVDASFDLTGNITGTVSGNSTHAAADVWSVVTRTLTANTNLNDPTAAAIATALLTTQMTEAYAADGVAPTLTEILFLIQQALTEFSISGTTTTIKKIDGSTTAATLTLNDGTTPTAVTRAT